VIFGSIPDMSPEEINQQKDINKLVDNLNQLST
jgi:hypothetical protein